MSDQFKGLAVMCSFVWAVAAVLYFAIAGMRLGASFSNALFGTLCCFGWWAIGPASALLGIATAGVIIACQRRR